MNISNFSDTNFFKNILSKNDLVAAPMAGITNIPFRTIIRDFFDGLIFTEMVSTEGVSRNILKSLKLAKTTKTDNPIIIQIFGKNKDSFEKAVKILDETVESGGYNINAGCPVKKVLKAFSGAYLLKDLKTLTDIIKTVRRSTVKPISLKARLGFEKGNYIHKELLRICENEGADAIIIHGRTKEDMFSGDIYYDKIAEIATISKIPVIGNGNVEDYASYKKMRDTKVQGVMIGRKMLKTPWIFKEIKAYPNNYTLNNSEIYELIYKLYELEIANRGEKHAVSVVKKYAAWFFSGFNKANTFRKKIFEANNSKEFLETLKTFSDDTE